MTAEESVSGALRTMIVDDEPLAVERMQVICAKLGDLAVVGTASDGAAALRQNHRGAATLRRWLQRATFQ